MAGRPQLFSRIIYVYRKIPMPQLRRGRVHHGQRQLLRQTLRYGSITALQQSCQPIGKLLIQGAVNPLGVDMIAAFNAVNRIDDYTFTLSRAFHMELPHLWRRTEGRAGRNASGRDSGEALCWKHSYWVFICITITLFRRPLMGLFVTAGNEGIVALGSSYLGLMALFYVFPAFTNGFRGFFREWET